VCQGNAVCGGGWGGLEPILTVAKMAESSILVLVEYLKKYGKLTFNENIKRLEKPRCKNPFNFYLLILDIGWQQQGHVHIKRLENLIVRLLLIFIF
jgi:hypothetical protein